MKLLVLDGNSILNRAFYGIRLLSTKDGRFTNGIYGFLTILFKLKENTSPDDIAIAFDVKAPTFRHEMYDQYKANRKGMPDELAEQLPALKALLKSMGYKILENPGYEADDIIGSLSSKFSNDGNQCYIATGDRDSLQLVNENVTVLLASTKFGKSETSVYDPDKIHEEYGILPSQLIDVKALMGDNSDNIPGVAGIGPKTALDLIVKFGSLDSVYDNIDSDLIKEGVRKKLINSKEQAYLSRKLGEIKLDVPIEAAPPYYDEKNADEASVLSQLSSLEMFKIIEKLGYSNASQIKKEKSKSVDFNFAEETDPKKLLNRINSAKEIIFLTALNHNKIEKISFLFDHDIILISSEAPNFDSFIEEFFSAENINKITHDIKPLHYYAKSKNFEFNQASFDLLIAAYLLNPSASNYSLPSLATEYKLPEIVIKDVSDENKEYSENLAILSLLYPKFKASLSGNEQDYLMYEIEMPLAEVLADMEFLGFQVDASGIKEFGDVLEARIGDILSNIYALAGFEFNVNSPKQLGEALFDKLGLPAKKKTKTGYSTNAEVLESLINEHPIIEMILEYRQLSKLKSTYCDGLLKLVNPDGRIRSTFNQAETRTGRISSAEPNLQNIPVRQELGREMRKFFIAKDGFLLVDSDYSQIELRTLAHISSDSNMIQAFNENLDIHSITASQVFHIPLEMVNSSMRNKAKAVNFGIVYGIGAFSLSKDINVTRAEADNYINEYFAHYSGVKEYMDRVIEEAKDKGYAQTMFNRRRYLPELRSSNAIQRRFGERVARNMPIQGAAADIIKIAMVRVYRRLKAENLEARLILQVHDELIIEAPENETEKVSALLKEEMENACEMKVKLLCDVSVGKTWYDSKA